MAQAQTAWLVDVGYVVKASVGKFKLDYVEAEAFLAERCGGPVQTFLFNGFDAAYGIPNGLQAFYDAMQRRGMVVRLQRMESGPPGSNEQRRVDVDLCAHLIWQASLPQVKTLVLTTGDQDFVPAVEMAHRQFGKKAYLFTYDAMVHHDLSAAADEWWRFEDDEPRLARW